MKTLLAELILIPVLLVAGYGFLVSASFSSMLSEGVSFVESYGGSLLPLSVIILVLGQMIILPARWGSSMFKRWLLTISAVCAVPIGFALFIDPFIVVIFILLYLAIVVSWVIRFLRYE